MDARALALGLSTAALLFTGGVVAQEEPPPPGESAPKEPGLEDPPVKPRDTTGEAPKKDQPPLKNPEQKEGLEGPEPARNELPAPRSALEAGIDLGYTQGFGQIDSASRVGEVADAGLGAGLTVGYRVSPLFYVGWRGNYQQFNADPLIASGTDVTGIATSIEVGFHFQPYRRLDPVVTIGSGYRILRVNPDGAGNDLVTHGFQLVHATAGLDFRVGRNAALGPMVGGDVDLFLWKNPEGSVGNQEIGGPRVSSFLYAGVQGRFDLTGSREHRPAVQNPAAIGSR